ncbi:MAG: hypothetical protein A2086_08370 [Spirochaetes bacterium GWD1_27_9]|nr:MAG: hypothetical protein A2Z98_13390 [Spirochaetes bacterium GWB1_27_13]OHD20913.1 MAG: hypothetical protein A2Y34_11810 [Spirochaetes bacterium GWC1_27_15]OHD39414.1 MAG: hypothetical protein A2086_08370 [Spirochaetes bacterium GWD1_27_9]
MIIVADSSPLISLAIIDKLDLIVEIFGDVIIPIAVYEEITEEGKIKSEELKEYFCKKTCEVNNEIGIRILNTEIDLGESEAIILALERNINIILMDDLKGRKYAEIAGLTPIGSIGVITKAKEKGLINQVKPYLDKLRENKIRISDDLYKKILEKSNEL